MGEEESDLSLNKTYIFTVVCSIGFPFSPSLDIADSGINDHLRYSLHDYCVTTFVGDQLCVAPNALT